MQKITLTQFHDQWVKNKFSTPLANKLYYNIFEFTTKTGQYSKLFFASSFATKSLFRSGKSWEQRGSKWGKRFTHTLMKDSSGLKIGISGKEDDDNEHLYNRGRLGGRSRFVRRKVYVISTNEISTITYEGKRKKRGKKYGKHRNYAAVHNSDPSKTNFTVNQYSTRKPVQRQFIGHSPVLNGFVATQFIPLIFKGFPHDPR